MAKKESALIMEDYEPMIVEELVEFLQSVPQKAVVHLAYYAEPSYRKIRDEVHQVHYDSDEGVTIS